MPPEASTNLPTWRSVAPVKAPFSWPNRIDSTRLSGIAPQFTVTKALPLRSLEPWMARASTSLPTPDSPSISTGMFDFAARSARRITRVMSGLAVARSLKLSVPEARRRMRRISSSSELTRIAFLIETWSRSAPTGLTTKSIAPARIAWTTVSIEPCAVCTMTGVSIADSRSFASTPSPSRFGITRSRMTTSMRAPSGERRSDSPASPVSARTGS